MREPQFRHHKKFQPDYNPYGTRFTERQERIIYGEPVQGLKKGEVTVVMRKLDKMGFDTLELIVRERYDHLFVHREKPKYTLEQSLAILRELSPW